MDCLASLDTCEVVLLVNAVAALLAAGRTTEEIDFLAGIFAAIGTLLTTISLAETSQQAKQGSDRRIKELQKQVQELQAQIKRLAEKCK